MSGLRNFVTSNRNGRAESPQNGQPTVNNPRRAIAANLKIPMKPGIARPPIAPEQGEQGESIVQHQATPVQQDTLPPQPLGDDRKYDPYDTDAESIDTTVNHSVVQVENSPQLNQQSHPGNAVYEDSGDEEGSDHGSDDEDADDDHYEFTEAQKQYLENEGAKDLSYREQLDHLSRGPSYLFQAVEGDSYPTTTDGNPTEWDGQQQESFGDFGSSSPSPERLIGHTTVAPMYHQQSSQLDQEAGMPHVAPVVRQNTRMFLQGAEIRGQQRAEGTTTARGQSGHQHITSQPLTSQPPTYSQANQDLDHAGASLTHARSYAGPYGIQGGTRNSSSRLSPALRPDQRIVGHATTINHVSATRHEAAPIMQQPLRTASVIPAIIEEHQDEERQEDQGDYDPEVLANMRYDELRDESFDKSPREQGHTLPEDMREKSLPERLRFAQQKLNPSDQANFFSTLPTAEWEEAGDWFLDQFTAIITKTREARQKKRKQARLFEEIIDGRHKQIVKKQRVVEDAMARMQVQGEGLVPNSPRVSKSPRPRRG